MITLIVILFHYLLHRPIYGIVVKQRAFNGRAVCPVVLPLAMVLLIDRGCSVSLLFYALCYRELICAIVQSKVGCYIGGMLINLLAYADDNVLFAPIVGMPYNI